MMLAFCAAGQRHIFNNPSNKAYWGVRAALDVNLPGKVKGSLGPVSVEEKCFGTGPGISAGVIYNIPLIANLYVEPGLFLGYDTESVDILNDNEIKDAFSSRSLRKFSGSIPVQFGYHFDLMGNVSFALFTGPVLKVGFSNDYYLTTTLKDGRDYHVSGSMYGDNSILKMNRVDCGWRIGVAANFSSYYIGLSGDIGMCDMVKGSSLSMHENQFQLTLGYNFR